MFTARSSVDQTPLTVPDVPEERQYQLLREERRGDRAPESHFHGARQLEDDATGWLLHSASASKARRSSGRVCIASSPVGVRGQSSLGQSQ